MNKLDKAIHTLKRIAGSGDLSVERLQQYAKDTLQEIAPRKRSPRKPIVDVRDDCAETIDPSEH